jgi:hypothetical protein
VQLLFICFQAIPYTSMCSSPDMIVRAAFVLGSALELQEEGRIAAGDSDGTDVLCRYDLVCFCG